VFVASSWGAMDFNGSSKVATTTASSLLAFTGTCTDSYWVNITTYGAGESSAAYQRGLDSGNWGVLSEYDTQKARFQIAHTDGGVHGHILTSLNDAPNAGIWYHRADVWDGTNLKIYINGNLDASSNIGSGTLRKDATETLTVANIGGVGSRYLTGKISDFAVWNTALTQQEISQLAIPIKGMPLTIRPSNLLTYFALNDGVVNTSSNTFVTDRSGNNLHGTSTGGIWRSEEILKANYVVGGRGSN
jgi:hypothetical protein